MKGEFSKLIKAAGTPTEIALILIARELHRSNEIEKAKQYFDNKEDFEAYIKAIENDL